MKATFLNTCVNFVTKAFSGKTESQSQFVKGEKTVEETVVPKNISGGSYFHDTFDRKTNRIRAARKIKNRMQGESRKANR